MLEAAGHLSAQMAVHILLMNAVAPMVALAAGRLLPQQAAGWRRLLFTAMAAQLAVLWAWHAPAAVDAAMQAGPLHLLMQLSLFLVALWFWSAVLHVGGDGRWRSIVALLLTSKLFCLLGVLLVFAPRAIYPGVLTGHGAMHSSGALADQQLAGLLMLVACPATYVLAGIVIAARWFGAMERGAGAPRLASERAPHALV